MIVIKIAQLGKRPNIHVFRGPDWIDVNQQMDLNQPDIFNISHWNSQRIIDGIRRIIMVIVIKYRIRIAIINIIK